MQRREFLASLGGLAASASAARLDGSILVHEHVLVDFTAGKAAYDPGEVFRIAKPHLDAARQAGVRRFQDCTPALLGRNPSLLRRLADATGLEIWTNTGYYSARNHQYLPDFVKTETPEAIAKRWIDEANRGVDGMKPKFIKIGVNRGPLDELDRKIVRAAAVCSRETGLAIQCHSGNGLAAVDELEIVSSERVGPSKLVWVHAYNEKDHSFHEKLARAGAWVQFDGVSPKSIDWHLACLEFMAAQGLRHRTLLSHDAGYYRPGEPGGGDFRGYTTIHDELLPKIDAAWARQLLVTNPADAYGK